MKRMQFLVSGASASLILRPSEAEAITYTTSPAPTGTSYAAGGMRRYYPCARPNQYQTINDVFYGDLESTGDFYAAPDPIVYGVNHGFFQLTSIWNSSATWQLTQPHFTIVYNQYSIAIVKGPQAGTTITAGLIVGRINLTGGESATWIYSSPYADTSAFLAAMAAAITGSGSAIAPHRMTRHNVVERPLKHAPFVPRGDLHVHVKT